MKPPSATELSLLLNWIANASTYDAWEDVSEMVRTEPEKAWIVIRDMIDVAPSHLLSAVAAGPLEDLLHEHGKVFAERMTEAASTDARFQACLGGVWLSEPKALARRIERALKRPAKDSPERQRAKLSKKRFYEIARWFHHSDTSWAPSHLEELIRTDKDAAWRLILLLVRFAEEEHTEVLPDVELHAFSMFVELQGPAAYAQVVAEAKSNKRIAEWIESRRSYRHVSEAWQGLLNAYPRPSSA